MQPGAQNFCKNVYDNHDAVENFCAIFIVFFCNYVVVI